MALSGLTPNAPRSVGRGGGGGQAPLSPLPASGRKAPGEGGRRRGPEETDGPAGRGSLRPLTLQACTEGWEQARRPAPKALLQGPRVGGRVTRGPQGAHSPPPLQASVPNPRQSPSGQLSPGTAGTPGSGRHEAPDSPPLQLCPPPASRGASWEPWCQGAPGVPAPSWAVPAGPRPPPPQAQ